MPSDKTMLKIGVFALSAIGSALAVNYVTNRKKARKRKAELNEKYHRVMSEFADAVENAYIDMKFADIVERYND